MTTIFDVNAQKLVREAAKELKKVGLINMPKWANFIKTGSDKQRPPESNDWWYFRCASLMKTIYKDGPVGIEKLRTKYGGRKNRGAKPSKFRKSGGKVIRTCLNQLEAAEYIQKEKSGRKISGKGMSFLDNIANKIKSDKSGKK